VNRRPARASDLYLRLSRDLALLIRLEAQAAASRHVAGLKRFTRELALLLVGIAGLTLAALFGSWTLVRLLEPTMRGWLASLVVAAGWSLVAIVSWTTLSGRMRRRRGSPDAGLATQRARAEADAARSIEELVELLAAELAQSEERRVARAARHELAAAEDELEGEARTLSADAGRIEARAGSAIEELVEIVTLPGRAGIAAIRRLVS